jgi:NitT/TauT family transport system substrate-binding protein
MVVSMSLQPVFLPIWITKEGGLFAQNDINADLQVLASTSGMAALVSGQLQVASVGGSEALSAQANGADLQVLATLAPVYPQVLIAPASIQSPADLKGKKAGVTNYGTSSDIATRVSLKQLGLDPDKDLTVVEVGNGSNVRAALEGGAISAGVVQPSDLAVMQGKGYHVLVDLAAAKLPAVVVSVVTQRSFLNANRPLMQKYIDAVIQGIQKEKKDKPFTIGVLKKYLKSDDDEGMAANYDYFARDTVTPSLPFPHAENFDDVKAVLARTNPKVADYDVSKMIDASFVQSAADRHVDAQ